MLIAEDVLLLLTDDLTGRPVVDTTRLDLALAGAAVLELATLGRVDVSGPGEEVRPGRLLVRDATPTGDPVLDETVRRIAARRRPAKPQDVLPHLTKGLRAALLDGLVSRGQLVEREGRVLGVFPTRSWPAADGAHEKLLLDGLRDVLVVGRTPTPREASVIGLLHAVDAVPKVLRDVGVPARELRRRAKAVPLDGFAEVAVRKAVEAVQAAMIAAVGASVAVAAASG